MNIYRVELCSARTERLNYFFICQQAVGKVWARSRPTPPGSKTLRLEHRGRISCGNSGSWIFHGCLQSDWWGLLRCSWCWLTAHKPATRNDADLQRIIPTRNRFCHIKGIDYPKILILSLFTHRHVVQNLHDFNSYAEHQRRYFKERWQPNQFSSHWLPSYFFCSYNWSLVENIR